MPEGIRVDARHPGQPGDVPAVRLEHPLALAGPAPLEPVDVQRAVEVVVLVLHASSEPAGRVPLQPVALDVLPDDVRAQRADEGEGLAGDREAALGVVVRVRVLGRLAGGRDHGVDHHPAVRHAVVVGHLVGEDPQPHTDLGGREAHAVGGVHRGVHVLDELPEGVVELGHRLRATVQHGLAVDDDGTDGHARTPSAGRSARSSLPSGERASVSRAAGDLVGR